MHGYLSDVHHDFTTARSASPYAKSVWGDVRDESSRLVRELESSGHVKGDPNHIALLYLMNQTITSDGEFVAWADADFCELLDDAASTPFNDPDGVEVEFGEHIYGTLSFARAIEANTDGYLRIGGINALGTKIHAISWFHSTDVRDPHGDSLIMMSLDLEFFDEAAPHQSRFATVTYQNDPGGFSSVFVRAGLILRAFFDLMHQQNVANWHVERVASIPSPDPKRKKRVRQPDVRVVALRAGTNHARAYSGTNREYRHRWMVRGHWRNQPYLKDGETAYRRAWIAPYLKGPSGAPLLTSPKVYAARGGR